MKNQKFRRTGQQRRYNRIIAIACEGSKTEPEYFTKLGWRNDSLLVKKIRRKNKSNPLSVLEGAKKYVRENRLQKNDEVWIIVDVDNWEDKERRELITWRNSNRKFFGVAISNPKFEYWLLLHFEDGSRIQGVQALEARLLNHLPNFDKSIDIEKLLPGIHDAIQRAEQKDTPKTRTWPRTNGTTVYRLVKSLSDSSITRFGGQAATNGNWSGDENLLVRCIVKRPRAVELMKPGNSSADRGVSEINSSGGACSPKLIFDQRRSGIFCIADSESQIN